MSVRFVIMVVAFGFGAAWHDQAAIPGADDPKAFTQHDYLKLKLDFNQRTLTGAYKAVGVSNAKWDGAAIKLLDAMAVHFTYETAEPVYQKVAPPLMKDLQALAKAASDAGCTDPLVLYCQAALAHEIGDVDTARKLLLVAVPGLVERKYPPYRISSAAGRLTFALNPKQDWALLVKNRQLSVDSAVASLSVKAADKDLRILDAGAEMMITGAPIEQKLAFCKALEASKDANPYFVNLYYGRYEIKAAWQARGGGWANGVGDEAWKQFYAHLEKAKGYLAKAHELHPDFPEAATEMITVAMGAGSQLNLDPRDWFEKAVKAQFDFYFAYASYTLAIYPKWGGSHAKMLDFGAECLATKRYDTYVPFRFLIIVESVNTDRGGDFAVFKSPRVYGMLDDMLENTAAKAPNAKSRQFYLSYHAALAWRTERYEKAAGLMEKLGANADLATFERVGAWAPAAISQIHAMNTLHGTRLKEAEAEVAQGDVEPAIITYFNIASKLPKDHPGQFFLRYRGKMLEIERDLSRGKWVSLTADADLLPFTVVNGTWKRDEENALVATADEKGFATLLLRTSLGPAYEIKAKVEPVAPVKSVVESVILEWSKPDAYTYVAIDPKSRRAYGPGEPFINQLAVEMPVEGVKEFLVRVNGLQVDFSVDGKLVLAKRPIEPAPGRFMGIGILGGGGRSVRFKDIEVRQLELKRE